MGNQGWNDETGEQQGALPSLTLLGTHSGTLDAKRRVAIPKVFRAQIDAQPDEAFVLCRAPGGEPCLALFPPGRFEAFLQERLSQLRKHSVGVGNKTVRAYMRQLSMSAVPVVPDRQSRITLSEEQCRLAGLTKEVTFAANGGDHLELWDPERLDDQQQMDFSELANEIFG